MATCPIEPHPAEIEPARHAPGARLPPSPDFSNSTLVRGYRRNPPGRNGFAFVFRAPREIGENPGAGGFLGETHGRVPGGADSDGACRRWGGVRILVWPVRARRHAAARDRAPARRARQGGARQGVRWGETGEDRT